MEFKWVYSSQAQAFLRMLKQKDIDNETNLAAYIKGYIQNHCCDDPAYVLMEWTMSEDEIYKILKIRNIHPTVRVIFHRHLNEATIFIDKICFRSPTTYIYKPR